MQYPSWYYALRNLSARQRYAAVCIVQSLLFAIWLFMLHPWIEHMVVQEGQQLQQQKVEQQSYTQTKEELVRLRKQRQQLAHELSTYAQQPKTNERMQRLIKDLERTGLVLKTISKDDVQEQGWYTVSTLIIEAQGNLEQIVQFLRQLKERTTLMDITRVRVQRIQNLYACTIGIHLYTLTKESPSTLKKAEGLGG